MIRVRFLGTRGSIASPGVATQRYGGNTSCIEVVGLPSTEPGAVLRPDNPRLVLDGGTGLASLKAFWMQGPCGQGIGELHILLSHFHWDHILGIPFFAPMFAEGNRVIFYGASLESLRASVERLFTSVYSPVKGTEGVAADLEFRQLELGVSTVAGFRVRSALNNHPGGALSFRLEYGPHVVVYTTDHEIRGPSVSELMELARGTDLWILGAQYTPEELRLRADWGHSSHLMAAQWAVEAGVRRVALFHHSPGHDDDTLDRMGREAARVAAGTETEVLMARDGMVIDVGRERSLV